MLMRGADREGLKGFNRTMMTGEHELGLQAVIRMVTLDALDSNIEPWLLRAGRG